MIFALHEGGEVSFTFMTKMSVLLFVITLIRSRSQSHFVVQTCLLFHWEYSVCSKLESVILFTIYTLLYVCSLINKYVLISYIFTFLNIREILNKYEIRCSNNKNFWRHPVRKEKRELAQGRQDGVL